MRRSSRLILVVQRWPEGPPARRRAWEACLQRAKARSLARGVFVVPGDDGAYPILRTLAREIVEAGGAAVLGRGTVLRETGNGRG